MAQQEPHLARPLLHAVGREPLLGGPGHDRARAHVELRAVPGALHRAAELLEQGAEMVPARRKFLWEAREIYLPGLEIYLPCLEIDLPGLEMHSRGLEIDS